MSSSSNLSSDIQSEGAVASDRARGHSTFLVEWHNSTQFPLLSFKVASKSAYLLYSEHRWIDTYQKNREMMKAYTILISEEVKTNYEL